MVNGRELKPSADPKAGGDEFGERDGDQERKERPAAAILAAAPPRRPFLSADWIREGMSAGAMAAATWRKAVWSAGRRRSGS